MGYYEERRLPLVRGKGRGEMSKGEQGTGEKDGNWTAQESMHPRAALGREAREEQTVDG